MIRARISGVGHAVPQNVVTNTDLTKFMDTSDEWIRERSGIVERRWARSGFESTGSDTNSGLAAAAISNALRSAHLTVDSIGACFYATITPDTEAPGAGAALSKSLFGTRPVYLVEVRNQCAGFMYALGAADAYIRTGGCEHAVVVGVEVLSSGLDLSTRGRNTAVLFGDGAGAVVLSKTDDGDVGIQSVILDSDGSFADNLGVPAPCFGRRPAISAKDFEGESPPVFAHMDGKIVFKAASQRMPEVVLAALKKAGATIEECACIVPHQANQRILDMLGASLGCPEKVFSNIAKYGNTTAASVPLALSCAVEEGRVKRGDLICCVAFGAGFSWGAATVRW